MKVSDIKQIIDKYASSGMTVEKCHIKLVDDRGVTIEINPSSDDNDGS